MSICIVSVFPELLGTYGDAGNVLVLARRLAWRDIDIDVVTVPVTSAIPATGDLYVLGGSEDSNMLVALDALRRSRLPRAVEAGAQVLAVCAGLQLLGRDIDPLHAEGLGILDLATRRLETRVVGEVVADLQVGPAGQRLTGFANHGAGSFLGADASPLGHVVSGRGNDGRAGGVEGAVQGGVVATYLHGPVLARNPWFADWLLERLLGRALEPLPADPSVGLHRELLRRVHL